MPVGGIQLSDAASSPTMATYHYNEIAHDIIMKFVILVLMTGLEVGDDGQFE